MLIRIVGSVGLDMSQNAGQTKGMPALCDSCANKVAQTDRTGRGCLHVVQLGRRSDTLVGSSCRFQGYSLFHHSHRIPANTLIDTIETIPLLVDFGGRPPCQEKGVFGRRMQIKHGRIRFATGRSSILSRSSGTIVVVE